MSENILLQEKCCETDSDWQQIWWNTSNSKKSSRRWKRKKMLSIVSIHWTFSQWIFTAELWINKLWRLNRVTIPPPPPHQTLHSFVRVWLKCLFFVIYLAKVAFRLNKKYHPTLRNIRDLVKLGLPHLNVMNSFKTGSSENQTVQQGKSSRHTLLKT